MTITLLQGDCTAILPTLAPASVQCVITSPPYYGLRDYSIPPTEWPAVEYAPMAGLSPVVIPPMTCCLGLETTPAAYVGHLVYVWRLLRRVLRDDGVCWLNLGDSYGTGGSGQNFYDPNGQRPGGGRTAVEGGMGHVRQRGVAGMGKQLLGIPWRAAFALQADGYYLRSDIIWAKPNPMPESVADRPTKAHEYLFLLAKQEHYFYDADAVAEMATQAGRIDDFKRPSRIERAAVSGRSPSGNELDGKWENPGKRNRRTVWNVASQPYSGAHFAVMPEALIDPCVKAGSSAMACEVCGAPWVRDNGGDSRYNRVYELSMQKMPASTTARGVRERPAEVGRTPEGVSGVRRDSAEGEPDREPRTRATDGEAVSGFSQGRDGSTEAPPSGDGAREVTDAGAQRALPEDGARQGEPARQAEEMGIDGARTDQCSPSCRPAACATDERGGDIHGRGLETSFGEAESSLPLLSPPIHGGSTGHDRPRDPTEQGRGTFPGEYRSGVPSVQQPQVESHPASVTGFRPTCAHANSGAARSVILDPFGGSGTVGRVAERLGRDAVLIELNAAYIDLQEQRTDGVQLEILL